VTNGRSTLPTFVVTANYITGLFCIADLSVTNCPVVYWQLTCAVSALVKLHLCFITQHQRMINT